MGRAPLSKPTCGAVGLAVLCLAGAAPAAAASAAAPIELRWTAPAGCPSEREVSNEIERLLGGPPDPSSPRHLRVEAAVSLAREGGLRVHLTTDMGGSIGERDLDAPSCAALAKAVALIVAFTFDPEAVAKRSPTRSEALPPPSPLAPTPAAPPPSAPSVASPTASLLAPRPPAPARPPARSAPPPLPPPRPGAVSSPSVRPTFLLGAAAALSGGALPSLGLGAGGGVGLLLGRFRADVSAAYWPDRRSSLATRPTAGGDVGLVSVDARACYAALLAPIELAPCAGFEAGSMEASGFGVKSPRSGAALWIAPLAEASAAVPLDRRFALRLDLGALAPLRRPTFVLERVGSVHRASALVGRAVLAVEARF
jgi:hypothetical protein